MSPSLGKGFGGSRLLGGFPFFVWTAMWGKILIEDNLRRRGYSLVDRPCICWCYGESMDHLLIHCEGAYHWWSFVFRSFRVAWVLPERVLNLLMGWWNWLEKQSSNIWNLAPLCLIWCIWRERKNCRFKDVESSWLPLFAFFVGTLFDWSSAWELTSSDSLLMFVGSLLACT